MREADRVVAGVREEVRQLFGGGACGGREEAAAGRAALVKSSIPSPPAIGRASAGPGRRATLPEPRTLSRKPPSRRCR
ncbi:hypothetical protein ACRAWC_14410 [Leifsonia sp. L25]|uniref:hypothetical protein n=1 Tax=Leifsonia sp. L25 TaxID=3423957 RepID=UPI003D683A60